MLLDECRIRPGEHILIAVSGGPDSMALLHVLAHLRKPLKIGVSCVAVDHGLRAEAAQELKLVQAFSDSLSVPFHAALLQEMPRNNLHHRLRSGRWEALESVRNKIDATRIATAHHLDDRAETVLLRLLRGSGGRGLRVLPPSSAKKIRPFIRSTKDEILSYIGRHAVPHVFDPSNRNPRFLRARVRFELLPLLRNLDPKIEEHLAFVADSISSSGQALTTYRISRATEIALDQLSKSENLDGEVLLPKGLVAKRAQKKGQKKVEKPLV